MAILNTTLVKIYVNLVLNGRRTVESVPTDYQSAVKTEVEKEQAAN